MYKLASIIIFVLIVSGCSNIRENISQDTETTNVKEEDGIPIHEHNNSINGDSRLISENKELKRKFNLLIEERDFWKGQDHKKLGYIELCRNKKSQVPQRSLSKEYICPQCDSYIQCEDGDSMLPFFDCDDKLTVYTDIKKEEVGICDIIGFKSPEFSELGWVLHQVVDINESGYTTKGIANLYPDSYIVQFNEITFKFIGVEQH